MDENLKHEAQDHTLSLKTRDLIFSPSNVHWEVGVFIGFRGRNLSLKWLSRAPVSYTGFRSRLGLGTCPDHAWGHSGCSWSMLLMKCQLSEAITFHPSVKKFHALCHCKALEV